MTVYLYQYDGGGGWCLWMTLDGSVAGAQSVSTMVVYDELVDVLMCVCWTAVSVEARRALQSVSNGHLLSVSLVFIVFVCFFCNARRLVRRPLIRSQCQ